MVHSLANELDTQLSQKFRSSCPLFYSYLDFKLQSKLTERCQDKGCVTGYHYFTVSCITFFRVFHHGLLNDKKVP